MTPRIERVKRCLLAAITALTLLGFATPPALANQLVPYQVQPGDTISELSDRFGVSEDNLLKENGLNNPDDLAIGQILLIGLPLADSPLAPFGETASSYQLTSYAASAGGTSPIIAGAMDAMAVSGGTSSMPSQPLLRAPYFSQFDGSIWGASNCGPTSLAMALGAVGVSADQIALRKLANQQMGFSDPDSGTTWEALAYAAKMNGVSAEGLYNGNSYHKWSMDDLKAELSAGRPVMLLVRYWTLPDHTDSSYAGDHYIVALGYTSQGNIIYNDPASQNGSYRIISPDTLNKSWSNTMVGYVRTAMALVK
ncbi:MAG TPA: C39 family peptidase [Chloroflexota bacterium]|nr:C39 family peptidase [Chloroflexota bacterium]